jgi:hypothetical protein
MEGLRTIEETVWTTINQDREASHGDTSKYPLPPFSTKPKTPQEIGELPINMIISCFHVQLANNAKNSQLQQTV